MHWLRSGGELASFGMDMARDKRAKEIIGGFVKHIPDIPISAGMEEMAKGKWNDNEGYHYVLKSAAAGSYIGMEESLIGDTLLLLTKFYPEDYLGISADIEDRKSRILKRGEVIENLTTIILDNWGEVADSFKPDIQRYMDLRIYAVNRLMQTTHNSMGDPCDSKQSANIMDCKMRVLILLDCIDRLDKLNRSVNIVVNSFGYLPFEGDEIQYIRSKLKSPQKEWQRGAYNWEKEKDCWVVSAYYGDPSHESVEAIRVLRSDLISVPVFGKLVTGINELYLRLGRSPFGRWWIFKVENEKKSLPAIISEMISRVLLFVASKASRKN